MIVKECYAVYDLKGEVFSPDLVLAGNDASAIRLFRNAIRDAETTIGRNPEDYVLYRVGCYNTENGLMAGVDAPIPVITGLECLKMQEVR